MRRRGINSLRPFSGELGVGAQAMTQRNRTPIDGSSSATILNSTAKPPTSSASAAAAARRRVSMRRPPFKPWIVSIPSYRSHRDVPNATGSSYYRPGTLSLYTALNTATGRVHGKTAARHTSRSPTWFTFYSS